MISTNEPEPAKKPDTYKAFCESLAPSAPTGSVSRYEISRGFPEAYLKNPAKLLQDAETYIERALFFSRPKTKRATDFYNNTFIVLEAHSQMLSKKFLIEHMKELKQAGFKNFFCELLFYDDQQLLDNYFTTGIMADKLKKRLNELDYYYGLGYQSEHDCEKSRTNWKKNNFTALIEAAHEAGIRIIGLDIESSCLGIKSGPKRDLTMPYIAAQIIKRETAIHKDSKYFALSGNAHEDLADYIGARNVQMQESKDIDVRLNHFVTLKNTDSGFVDLENIAKKDIRLYGDIFITGNADQPLPKLSLSDARKGKLEDIQAILNAPHDAKEEEPVSSTIGSVIIKLINETLLKPTVTEEAYKSTIQKIHLLLTKKTESKKEIFDIRRMPSKSESEIYQKILEIIAPDLPLPRDETTLEAQLKHLPSSQA